MKQHELEEKLDQLRRQRGAAVLDGKKVDNNSVAAVEAEIAALNDAAAEETRRSRAQAEATHQSDLSVKRTQLAALIQADLDDTKEAEAGARQLAAAYSRKLERNTVMVKLAHEITRGPAPLALFAPEVVIRLACQLAAVMSSIPKHRYRFGAITWNRGVRTPEESWVETEFQTLHETDQPDFEG